MQASYIHNVGNMGSVNKHKPTLDSAEVELSASPCCCRSDRPANSKNDHLHVHVYHPLIKSLVCVHQK